MAMNSYCPSHDYSLRTSLKPHRSHSTDILKSIVRASLAMSDAPAADADQDGAEAGVEEAIWSRDTAPQTPFTLRQVGIGFVIAAVGAVVAFGLPLLLA